ncbi:MAG: FAD-dependent oxidoreductase [Myxococcota bacterium]|nr:FAD-dependent oxidoreductase [Myxococcota bacterium]
MPTPPTFEARLLKARALSPSVRELGFERLDGEPMAFEPGQWLNALTPVAKEPADMKRSYSIASPPDGSPGFDIAITRVHGGPVSTWFHAVDPGTLVQFTGPQGFFTRPPASGAPALMIATGTGVAPMRSMILAAVAAGARTPMSLLLGVRHEEDSLYADEFHKLAREHPFIRFEVTLSQPSTSWQGRRGYVQAHVRELWSALAAGNEENTHAYVCGLQRMIGSVRDLLRKDMGLARRQVHSERYD